MQIKLDSVGMLYPDQLTVEVMDFVRIDSTSALGRKKRWMHIQRSQRC